MRDLTIGMAGAGGDGVVSAGESLITAAASAGYHAILTKSFGPQIRGGESSFRLRISSGPVHTPGGMLDVAVALNWDDFVRFGAELPVAGHTVFIHDAQHPPAPGAWPGVMPAEIVAAPIAAIARELAGHDAAKNTVVLGLMAEWFGFVPDALLAGLRKRFAKKSAEVLERNERAFEAGRQYAIEHPLARARRLDRARPPGAPTAMLLADGNEMCAAGAIFAGCTFFGGYPITPSTEIMQLLGRELWKHGGVVLQAEDEIAGAGAAVGASFAGHKAMTATSGPGMSLKTEMLGLASIAELPLVCVNVQRGGPSTGMPTKSEQSDLFQAVFSAHGDVVRPVLAPTSVADVFETTVEAFNIAEQYQTPVIVLSDGEIGQRKEIVDPIDTGRLAIVDRRRPSPRELEKYVRYALTESGISPISEPGMPGGNYLAAGIEHNEQGAPTANGAMHARMNEKRIRKLDPLARWRGAVTIAGDPHAPIGLIAWGSVAGVAREALGLAERLGVHAKLLAPTLLYPVPQQAYDDFFASVRTGLIVEQSHQGQLYRLLRMFVTLPAGVASLARSGANPFTPTEIAERLAALAQQLQRARVPEVEASID
ncbi:MAG TPA: 2-oxoacid:acceptor oxidoreductase subunit alpha [Vicinamibacterales bacterium]|nr:2-oxoacid:acceptor oxidoreductase subunit alpha [Vicinamibacterales bacterium]